MSDIVAYGEYTFDEIRDFGDNSDRVNDIMMQPSLGLTSVLRHAIDTGKRGKINCIAIGCDFNALLLSGAYTTAQVGARVQIRFDSTVKFETQFNWTGLSGYIGGADDYNSEGEVMLSLNDQEVGAGTVIDVYVTGGSNVDRAYYIQMYGVLDDGTNVRTAPKQFVIGTTATAISLYTVPAGRTLYIRSLVISTRHIDIYAGKGYLVYNGVTVMVIDMFQTELGGVCGIVLPFYEAPLSEGCSIGFRHDSYACGGEVVTAALYGKESTISTGGGGGGRNKNVFIPIFIHGRT